MTWPVEVLTSGNYNVELYYACPKKDVGATLELSCGPARLTNKITMANDPPEVGAAEDRFPRTESYVKDFRPLKMGTITLQAGHHELKLQAPSIPGETALEFRMLMFHRQ